MDTNSPTIKVPMPDEQPTLTVWPEAGKILNLSRSGAYAAANAGDIPIVRFGRVMRVPTAALRRMLDLDNDAAADARRFVEEHGLADVPRLLDDAPPLSRNAKTLVLDIGMQAGDRNDAA